jgi:hypothetical protein
MGTDNFGEIDLNFGDDTIDEDPPPSTQRAPGAGTLTIDDKCTALFTSATWTLTASVKNNNGTVVIQQSTENQKSHTKPFIARWARQVIRQNVDKLRWMGVDVEQVYLSWGGLLADLDPDA